LSKWVQVDDHQVDEADALARERRQIVRMIAAREDAAVDRRVQRLDAAVHHLREAGHVGDGDHRQAGIAQRARRAAGRDQLEAARGEPTAQVDDACLVGDAQYRSWHIGQSSVLSLRRRAGLAP
jgi:hypothetical protein